MDSFFSALITLHSISVTHHSSLRIPHPVWHHHSLVITQYFLTVCGLHTYHLVKAKLFCGPHHFLFSHFPTFTPVTLPKHKPEPNFNHNNKNNNDDNNKTNLNPASTTITKTATTRTTSTTAATTTTKCGQLDG